MARYCPATLPVEYIGEHPRVLREIKYARFEPKITMNQGDIIFLPVLTATALCRKNARAFKMLDKSSLEETATGSMLSDEESKADTSTSSVTDTSTSSVTDTSTSSVTDTSTSSVTDTSEGAANAVVITPENIMDESVVTLAMIKEACKEHKITIGKKKRADLVALLLPYLEQKA